MVDQTAEQQLEFYKKLMGEDLGPVFRHCRQRLLSLTIVWDQFETLFGNQERVDLMNEAGGSLAFNIYWQFLEGVTLGITRLLDPAQQKKFRNLSLYRLVDLCPQDISEAVRVQLEAINSSSQNFRLLRDKVIAHSDIDHVTGVKQPLAYPSRHHITMLLAKILEFLNTVDKHYGVPSGSLSPMGNRDAFVHLRYLHRGAIAKKEMLGGSPDDFLNNLKKYEKADFLKETDEERDRYRSTDA